MCDFVFCFFRFGDDIVLSNSILFEIRVCKVLVFVCQFWIFINFSCAQQSWCDLYVFWTSYTLWNSPLFHSIFPLSLFEFIPLYQYWRLCTGTQNCIWLNENVEKERESDKKNTLIIIFTINRNVAVKSSFDERFSYAFMYQSEWKDISIRI